MISRALTVFTALACLGAPMASAQPPVRQDSVQQTDSLRRVPLDRVVAVVGTAPILWSDVQETILQRVSMGLQLPQDSAGQLRLAEQVVQELVDEEGIIPIAGPVRSVDSSNDLQSA